MDVFVEAQQAQELDVDEEDDGTDEFRQLAVVQRQAAVVRVGLCSGRVKAEVSTYIVQYPVLRIAQCFTLYFPDRPVHSDTISASLEASSHMLQ